MSGPWRRQPMSAEDREAQRRWNERALLVLSVGVTLAALALIAVRHFG